MIKSNRRNNGFTLIELLVVVLILGILLAIAIPSYLSSVATSRINTCNSNLKSIAVAVQAKYVKSGGAAYAAGDLADATVVSDLGGSLPLNPCSGGKAAGTDWITTPNGTGTGTDITAKEAPNCAAGSTTAVHLGS